MRNTESGCSASEIPGLNQCRHLKKLLRILANIIPVAEDAKLDEPGVAITDFMLAVECMVFAILLAKNLSGSSSKASRWFVSMFAFTSLASFTGGILHGFFDSPTKSLHLLFWDITLLAVGAVAVSIFNVAAQLLSTAQQNRKRVFLTTTIASIAYAAYVLTGYRNFLTAILFYLPSTILLTVALVQRYRRQKTNAARCGITGMVLTYIAATVQQVEAFYIEPYILNHNSVYHILLGIAFYFLFRFATSLSSDA